MKKKRITWIVLALAIFFLVLPFVLASEEEIIYSTTVRSEETVFDSVRGYPLQLKAIGDKGVYVDFGNRSLLIITEHCESEGNLKLCAGSASFLYRNKATWTDVYSIPFTIELKRGFVFNQTISKTKLMIDETSNVKVAFFNDGVVEITNITFNDSYPPEIGVFGVDGCWLNNNVVEWSGSLAPFSRKKCSYTLLAREGIAYKSEPGVGYYDGWEMQFPLQKGFKIRVLNHSLNTNYLLNSTKWDIGGIIALNFTLNNIHSRKVPVRTWRIDLPPGLKVLRNSNELEYKGDFLFWKGILDPLEQKNFSLTLRAEESGNFSVKVTEAYLDNIFERSFTQYVNFSIGCDCLKVGHTLNQKDEQTAHLRIMLSNPSADNKFKNIRLDVSSNIPGAEQIKHEYPFLAPKEDLVLFDGDLPLEGLSSYYDITVNSYSPYGQPLETSKSILLTEAFIRSLNPQESEQEFGTRSAGISDIQSPPISEANFSAQRAFAQARKYEGMPEAENLSSLNTANLIKLVLLAVIILAIFLILASNRKRSLSKRIPSSYNNPFSYKITESSPDPPPRSLYSLHNLLPISIGRPEQLLRYLEQQYVKLRKSGSNPLQLKPLASRIVRLRQELRKKLR